jgi:hypothetical protein
MPSDPLIQSEILSYLGQLDSDDQARVVGLARSLANASRRGSPGKDLLRLVGTIPHDELERMKQAIEEECERVERHEG